MLQEGLSEKQFAQMVKAGIRLVVPAPLFSKYPKQIRSKLMSLENFITEIRHLRILN